MALCLLQFLMDFSERLFLCVLQGTWLYTTVDSSTLGVSEYTVNASEVTNISPFRVLRRSYHSTVITELPVSAVDASPENRVCEATKTSTGKDLRLPTVSHCL